MAVRFALALAAFCAGTKQVLLLRHCVRSPYPELYKHRAAPGFTSADNYTAKPFPPAPAWGTKGVAMCTPVGEKIAASLGLALREKLVSPVAISADNVSRCIATAERLADGLGKPAATVSVDQKIFDPVAAKVCSGLTTEQYNADIEDQLAVARDPASYLHATFAARQQFLTDLQGFVGAGEAPALSAIPENVSHGYYTGGIYVAAEGILSTFVLEAGAGLPVAWGALDGAARPELYKRWEPYYVLYSRINHGGRRTSERNGAAALWKIVRELQGESSGSSVLVGHDTTLDAIANLLGLFWQCGAFAPNAAPPTSGLLFTLEGDDVLIEAVCTPFEGTESVAYGPVSSAGSASAGAADFRMSLSAMAGRVPKVCVPGEEESIFI